MIPQEYAKFKPIYFAKGKRSMVYTFTKNNKKFVLKIVNSESKAHNRMENEAKMLKLLNQYSIGPRIVDSGEDYVCMEYVRGIQLKDSELNFRLIKKILEQCFTLDKLKIIKEEMHKPLKHIFISKNKITMIDFERCHYTDKPKNVTQFVQFIQRMFHIENEKLKSLLRLYKHEQTKENLDSIRKEIEKAIKQS